MRTKLKYAEIDRRHIKTMKAQVDGIKGISALWKLVPKGATTENLEDAAAFEMLDSSLNHMLHDFVYIRMEREEFAKLWDGIGVSSFRSDTSDEYYTRCLDYQRHDPSNARAMVVDQFYRHENCGGSSLGY